MSVANISINQPTGNATTADPHSLLYIRTYFIIGGVLIFLVNGGVLVIMAVTPALVRQPRKFLILSMAITDSTFGLYVCFSNTVYLTILDLHTEQQCIVEKILGYSFFTTSLLQMALVSIERYYATSWKKTKAFRGRKKVLFVALSWIISFVSMAIVFLVFRPTKNNSHLSSCVIREVYGENVKFVNLALSCFLVPWCVLILVSHLLTARNLNRLKIQLEEYNQDISYTANQNQGVSHKANQNQDTRMTYTANQNQDTRMSYTANQNQDTRMSYTSNQNQDTRMSYTANQNHGISYTDNQIYCKSFSNVPNEEEKLQTPRWNCLDNIRSETNSSGYSSRSQKFGEEYVPRESNQRYRMKSLPVHKLRVMNKTPLPNRMSNIYINYLRKAFNTTRKMLLVVALFSCPFIVTTVLSLCVNIPRMVDILCKFLVTLNSVLNPFIYAWVLKDFRKAFIRKTCSLCRN